MKDREPVPEFFRKIVEAVAAERGTTSAELVKELINDRARIEDMVVNTEGKYRVLGVDRFDNEDWLSGEFGSAEEAIKFAREKTDGAKSFASDSSIATIYYAYTPDGCYIGGDTWVDSKSST